MELQMFVCAVLGTRSSAHPCFRSPNHWCNFEKRTVQGDFVPLVPCRVGSSRFHVSCVERGWWTSDGVDGVLSCRLRPWPAARPWHTTAHIRRVPTGVIRIAGPATVSGFGLWSIRPTRRRRAFARALAFLVRRAVQGAALKAARRALPLDPW